jgi:hypothetical protein
MAFCGFLTNVCLEGTTRSLPLLPGLRIGFCVFLREYFSSPVEKLSYYGILARRREGGRTGISLQLDHKNIDLLI